MSRSPRKRPAKRPPDPRSAICTKCLRATDYATFCWSDGVCWACFEKESRPIEVSD